jgi:hypothetical protein
MPVDDERSEDSDSTEVATPEVGASDAGSSLRRAAESATGSIWLLKWYRAGSYLRVGQ